MKKYLLFFHLSLVALLSSCDKQEEAGATSLKVNAWVKNEQQTRGSINGFSSGDELGLFVIKGSLGDFYEGLPSNIKSTFNGLSWTTGTVFLTGTSGTVYAYYPYNESYLGNGSDIPLEIASQTDYLYGKGSRPVNMVNPIVDIEMKHVLTQIIIKVKKINYDSEAILKSITISNTGGYAMTATGIFNLETEAISRSGTGSNVSVNCNEVLSGEYKEAHGVLMFPFEDNADYQKIISVTIQTPVKLETYNVILPHGLSGESGMAYIYPLTLNGTALEFNNADVTIIPWGDTLTGNASPI